MELLQTYKYQALIEKRHEQLKTAAEVVPVNFKSPERIEALLFLYVLAITLHALIERQVRRAMAARPACHSLVSRRARMPGANGRQSP